MATDNSEPRTGLIAQIAVLAVVTLIAVHTALVSYFDRVKREEEFKKIGAAPRDALMSLRAEESQRLTSGPMPIDKAMQQLVERGRMGAGSEIAPTESKDMAPLQGWSKMPAAVPPPMMAPPPAPPAPVPSSSAAPAPDGGAAPGAAVPDAGAAPPAAAPDAGNRPNQHP